MKIGSVGEPKLGGVRKSMLSGKHEVGVDHAWVFKYT